MGDDKVYLYIKELVDRWRDERGDIVTVDEILTNLSLSACDKCGGSGKTTAGTDCETCGGDGLRTFIFVGNVVDVNETMTQQLSGVPPNDYYLGLAKMSGATRTKVKPKKDGQVTEERRLVVSFTVDDGENAVRCCVHNFEFIYPNGYSDAQLPDAVKLIRESFSKGKRVVIRGKPSPYKETKFKEVPYVFVDQIIADNSDFGSRMTDKDLEMFVQKCAESVDYEKDSFAPTVTPLNVAKTELWKPMEVPSYVKETMLLWCISPQNSHEQFHIALVTDPGEGKDYMVRKVLMPISRVGIASGRLTTSIPSLVGAMSTNNLAKMSLGLLPRYHNARVAVTEFGNWLPEMWSVFLGVLADGEVIVSKGEISGRRRPTCLNLLLLGNPKHFDADMPKLETLGTFGDYTYPMISRCSVVLVVNKLADNEELVRKKQLENIDRDSAKYVDPRLSYFQEFYKEYFRKVSALHVPVSGSQRLCDMAYDYMAKDEKYRNFMTTQGRRDNRKYEKFYNLVKYFAKLNGRLDHDADSNLFIKLSAQDVRSACQLFMRSAASLAEHFDFSLMDSNVGPTEQKILQYVVEHPGQTKLQIRKELGLFGDENDMFVLEAIKTLQKMGRIVCIDEQYYPDRNDPIYSVPPSTTTIATVIDADKEGGMAPTISPSAFLDISQAEKILKDQLKVDDSVAELLADMYCSLKLSGNNFALRAEKESRGQISQDLALKAYDVLQGRGGK